MSASESREQPHVPAHTQRSPSTDKVEQQRSAARQIKAIRMAFALTFNTPEGKQVLKWLFRQAGYGESQIGGNPQLGMDVLQGTLYNNARQSLYIEMRKMIPHELLKQVEFDNVEEELL